MDKTNFLLIQIDSNHTISEECAAFIDACQQKNWLDGTDTWKWRFSSWDISSIAGIPIGSVGFINTYLEYRGLPALRALNVPEELRKPEFLHRKVYDVSNREEVARLVRETGAEFLLKPGRSPKKFEATLSKYLDELQYDGPFFVSQLLDSPIVAEWRAFVLRGQVLSIRPYILQEWVFPDRTLVESTAKQIKCQSCTIDFAVLKDGRTALLEAHQFLACGLYGFSGPDLLRMAKTAWLEHVG